MKKRTVSLLLTLCLLLTLLPTVASAADVPTKLEVGGTSVVDGGYWRTTSGGELTAVGATKNNYNVAYEAGSGVLKLKNATIRRYSRSPYGLFNRVTQVAILAGIHSDATITIELEGTNTIDLSRSGQLDTDCAGIALGKNDQWLTFTGTGSLAVKSGKTSRNSFGLLANSSITVGQNASDTCSVTLLGGECGKTMISAGIYNQGTLDDRAACVTPKYGSLTAGTAYGGAGSYGVYGKVELSESGYNPYSGEFIAYCGEATTAVALSTPPMFMPVGANSALLAEKDGTEVAYRNEENGLYTRVELHHDLQTGASIGGVEVLSTTPYTVEVKPITAAANGQVVEYALTKSGEKRTPVGGWQTSSLFVGLSEDTIYEVVARTAATTEYAAGPCVRIDARTPKSNKNDYSVSTGLSVDGYAINTKSNLSNQQIGDDPSGRMSYDSATRTLTFSGKVVITHGCKTIGRGEAVGIFSNNKLNIVLADGADVTINMANYARDIFLSDSLEGHLENGKLVGSDPITGRATGILCQGDLTINAADDCTTKPKLTIKVFGAGDAQGIRTVETRDGSSAVIETGSVTIGTVDVDITVGAMSALSTLNPSLYAQRKDGSAGVCGIYAGNDIVLNGADSKLNIWTTGGYQGYLLNAGEIASGGVFMQGTEVHLENKARNGNYRVSCGAIKWDDGYTCTDSAENQVVMKDAYWVTGSADFDPNGEPVLGGNLIISVSGQPVCGKVLTAELSDSNLEDGDKPLYTWYRYYYGTTTLITSSYRNTYTLVGADASSQIYCEVTCAGYAGKKVSAMTATVEYSKYPEIYVCGIKLEDVNAADVLSDGSGSVSYDIGRNVLTLNNATLTSTGDKDAIIYVPGPYALAPTVTIELIGENKMSVSESGKEAIHCYALNFMGSGSLDASADCPTKGTVYADGNVTISGSCEITLSAKNNPEQAKPDDAPSVLFVRGKDLTISDNSSLRIFIEDTNVYRPAVLVSYLTTVKDNASLDITGRCCEALVTAFYNQQGGTVRLENGDKYVKSNGSTGNGYSAMRMFDMRYYQPQYGEVLLNMSGGKLDVISKYGYAIETGYNGMLDKTANPIVITGGSLTTTTIDTETPYAAMKLGNGEIVADNCTVYAGTSEDDAEYKTAAAFLSKNYRYVRLVNDSFAEFSARRHGSTVTADLSVGMSVAEVASVLIAHYNAEGKLMELRQPTLNLSSGMHSINAEFTNASDDDTYKVFLLNNDRYVPMSAALAP